MLSNMNSAPTSGIRPAKFASSFLLEAFTRRAPIQDRSITSHSNPPKNVTVKSHIAQDCSAKKLFEELLPPTAGMKKTKRKHEDPTGCQIIELETIYFSLLKFSPFLADKDKKGTGAADKLGGTLCYMDDEPSAKRFIWKNGSSRPVDPRVQSSTRKESRDEVILIEPPTVQNQSGTRGEIPPVSNRVRVDVRSVSPAANVFEDRGSTMPSGTSSDKKTEVDTEGSKTSVWKVPNGITSVVNNTTRRESNTPAPEARIVIGANGDPGCGIPPGQETSAGDHMFSTAIPPPASFGTFNPSYSNFQASPEMAWANAFGGQSIPYWSSIPPPSSTYRQAISSTICFNVRKTISL